MFYEYSFSEETNISLYNYIIKFLNLELNQKFQLIFIHLVLKIIYIFEIE